MGESLPSGKMFMSTVNLEHLSLFTSKPAWEGGTSDLNNMLLRLLAPSSMFRAIFLSAFTLQLQFLLDTGVISVAAELYSTSVPLADDGRTSSINASPLYNFMPSTLP